MMRRGELVALAWLTLACSPPPIGADEAELTGTATDGSTTTETSTGEDPCASATEIIEADVLIESAAELADYADVIEIRGDLQISDDSMVELVGLHCLERVEGTVTISGNAALERIDDALGRLREITSPTTAGLSITQNPELVSLTGLAALERVDNRMLVTDNPALVELRFDALEQVGEHLTIADAPLPSLTGLAALREVVGSLRIADCDALVDLDGLQGLEALGTGELPGGLTIDANDELLSLDGLALAAIPIVRIRGNAALVDLAGLEALTSVESLIIEDNPALGSLAGLDNLAAVTGSDPILDGVSIVRNPALTQLAGLNNLAQITSHLHLCDNPQLVDLSALSQLEQLGRLTAIYNDTLDSDAASQLGEAIADVEWIKVDANDPLPPMWWAKPECPWAGDGVCDELWEFQGDVEESCEQDCCALGGPTHLCAEMTDGEGRGDCIDEPWGP